MSSAAQAMAVLFADVGSTRLYEQVGDATAPATIGECLALVQPRRPDTPGVSSRRSATRRWSFSSANRRSPLRRDPAPARARARRFRRASRRLHCGQAIESHNDVYAIA
jgi:hypothetical protein